MFCIQQLRARIIPLSLALFLQAEKRFRSAEHRVDNVNYTFCAGQALRRLLLLLFLPARKYGRRRISLFSPFAPPKQERCVRLR